MGYLLLDVQDDISMGVLSFNAIAKKYGIPLHWVAQVWDNLCEQELASDPHVVQGFNEYS